MLAAPTQETPLPPVTPGWWRLASAVFCVAIFLNAGLLFIVQPMFSKMVLPLLGGTPAVWNTCMLFFQAALFVGYLVAHIGPKYLGVRRHGLLHVGLLTLSLLVLPLALPSNSAPPATAMPVGWLLSVLTVSVGLPFTLLAAGSPLLQRWFAAIGHPASANPYFLYAASNLGSFCALLAYPFLVEPSLRLPTQALTWSVAYSVLILVLGCCLALVARARPLHQPPSEGATVTCAAPAAPTMVERARWTVLAAVPSSLLLGVTTYLSTDVAAVPLMWVVPLALYLLTFTIAFGTRPLLRHAWMVRAQPFAAVVLLLVLASGVAGRAVEMFPVHLAVFFITAMVCHGELARTRPAASHLTEFYLWLSLGGVLGGGFNAIVAPLAFQSVVEYPIIFALACVLRPARSRSRPRSVRTDAALDWMLPTLVALVLGVFLSANPAVIWRIAAVAFAGMIAFASADRPVRYGLTVAATFLATLVSVPDSQANSGPTHESRNFFGVLRVLEDSTRQIRMMAHGTTNHGVQSLRSELRLQPLFYYHADGPLGTILQVPPGRTQSPRRVGIMGLGTGGLACYGRTGERWTYYEIDPAVERLARDPRYFTFLRDCPPKVDVRLGDARLLLTHEPDREFDVLVMDAFSSDAIPVHLVTREAIELYMAKLAPGGLLVIHISNAHLDLEPLVGALAHEVGLASRVRFDPALGVEAYAAVRSPTKVAVLARSESDLGHVATLPGWRRAVVRKDVSAWTDDFSNPLSLLGRPVQ